VNDLEQRTGRRVDRDIRPPAGLTSEQEVVAYRIAQEALTNALRHADGASIRLELGRVGHATVLVVEDKGPGAMAIDDGTGIRGMRERALLVGARLTLDAPPGRGVRVRLVLNDGAAA
jgi:two-component system sensor histidine kinase UhpB